MDPGTTQRSGVGGLEVGWQEGLSYTVRQSAILTGEGDTGSLCCQRPDLLPAAQGTVESGRHPHRWTQAQHGGVGV